MKTETIYQVSCCDINKGVISTNFQTSEEAYNFADKRRDWEYISIRTIETKYTNSYELVSKDVTKVRRWRFGKEITD